MTLAAILLMPAREPSAPTSTTSGRHFESTMSILLRQSSSRAKTERGRERGGREREGGGGGGREGGEREGKRGGDRERDECIRSYDVEAAHCTQQTEKCIPVDTQVPTDYNTRNYIVGYIHVYQSIQSAKWLCTFLREGNSIQLPALL